jgi:phosphoribosylformylglycinamidine (FGAM) synthase PurS component
MLWEVDVHLLDPAADHAARAVVAGAAELGIGGCTKGRTAAGWLIEGELTKADAERLAGALLADPVTESFTIAEVGDRALIAGPADLPTVLHVLPRAGVTDPAAQSA